MKNKKNTHHRCCRHYEALARHGIDVTFFSDGYFKHGENMTWR